MKQLSAKIILTLGILWIFTGCQDQFDQNGENADFKLSNFGHLDRVSEVNPSSLFLITHPKDKEFKICLSSEMANKFPGIKDEIYASINIWGHYIGRIIPITIKEVYLPFPSENWSSKDIFNVYTQHCEGPQDLFIAETPVKDSRIGNTTYLYSFKTAENGKKNIGEFNRILSLTRWPKDQDKKFISLEQVTKKATSGSELLNKLVSRTETIYIKENNRNLTLNTLIHEFGHVWGLCDQYPIDGQSKTNCDPRHSVLDVNGHILLEENAIMAKGNWKNPLGLHDDDILGIIDLAERSDVEKLNWDLPNKNLEDFPARMENENPIKFFTIKNTTIENRNLIIDTAIDLNEKSDIHIYGQFDNHEFWSYMVSFRDIKTTANPYTLTLTNIRNLDKIKKIKVTVEPISASAEMDESKVLSQIYDVKAGALIENE